MPYGLSLASGPASEPLTLAEAKKQVELATQDTAHDEHLLRLIAAARKYAEDYTGRAIVTQTWDLFLDSWPVKRGELTVWLPKPPLQSVTFVKYYDGDGVQQTWSSANYVVRTSREPGCISLAYGISWPTFRFQPDTINIRYVAGYGARTSVPENMKAAMLLMVGHWFSHREEVVAGQANAVPFAAHALLDTLRVGDEFQCYWDAQV